MKLTFDLPRELVRQLKVQAASEGRTLRDLVEDLLRQGLATKEKFTELPVILKDEMTGLPVIQCPHAPMRKRYSSPDRIARILNDQETEWARGFEGH